MTRNINSEILTKLAENEIRLFHLLEITLDGYTYRVTDCDVPISLPDDIILAVEDITLSLDGSTGGLINQSVPVYFSPVPDFKFSVIRYSVSKIVDKADLSFSMINNPEMLYAFVGGEPQGSLVIIRAILLDDDYKAIGNTSATIFEGTVDAWSTTEENIKMTVVSAISQWSQKALRTHGTSCQWKVFKGQTKDSPCMYNGNETWCDRTYKRCQQLGNTNNYGGFRWLHSIVDKEIWWGRNKG